MTDTATETNTEITTVVDAYVASWNEADPAKRTALVQQAWAPEARYIDPLLDLTGHEALATFKDLLDQHYPGHRINRTSDVDTHHGYLRFSWEMVGPDGTAAVTGIDVGMLAEDGRLQGIAGFFN
jgi:hypothetical protein